MSKKIAPTRGEGITTSAILTANTESQLPREFSVATFAESLERKLEEHAIAPMATAVQTCHWIEVLGKVIRDTAVVGLKVPGDTPNAERIALSRIRTLGEIVEYLACDFGNHIDVCGEQLENEHLPALLAALPQRGEA